MRILIILLLLVGCAKEKPEVKEQRPPQQQCPTQRYNAEFTRVGYDFIFCHQRLCCVGNMFSPLAQCSY